MVHNKVEDRAAGAIMGAWIGDALGLGPHWYYDLDELHRDYGEWISDYTDPRPGRYHDGMHAGQLSQSGFILKHMVLSLVEQGGYDERDFCRRMDEELFPLLNGEPISGPGGYTNQSMREAWHLRVNKGLPWGQVAGHTDTTEAMERTLAIAVCYALHPGRMIAHVTRNALLTHADHVVVSMTSAYCAVLAMLVQGNKLDAGLSAKLMKLVKDGTLPFHSVTHDHFQPPRPGDSAQSPVGSFASPDALLSPSYMAMAAADPDIRIEPAWKVSLVYGMPCAIYHMLPAAYYLAARFHDDFESGVLHAINGGGNNLARALLTGALIGAQVGLSGIPGRFVDKLENGKELQRLALELAAQAAGGAGT